MGCKFVSCCCVFNPKRKVKVKNWGLGGSVGLGIGYKLWPPDKGLPCNTRAAVTGFTPCSAGGTKVREHFWSQLSFLLTHLSLTLLLLGDTGACSVPSQPSPPTACPQGNKDSDIRPLIALNKHCISLNH